MTRGPMQDRSALLAALCGDVLLRSRGVAAQYDERFSQPAEAVSIAGRELDGTRERAKAALFAGLAPLL